MTRERMFRLCMQALTTVVGLSLVYWGLTVALSHEGAWSMWDVVASLGPAALGVTLALPQAVDRSLQVIAPRIPWLHSHDEEEEDDG